MYLKRVDIFEIYYIFNWGKFLYENNNNLTTNFLTIGTYLLIIIPVLLILLSLSKIYDLYKFIYYLKCESFFKVYL